MKYKVLIADSVEWAMAEYSEQIAQNGNPGAALKWLTKAKSLIISLENYPNRFQSVADEFGLATSTRSVIHYSHRIIFRVDESTKTVFVVAFIHASLDVDLSEYKE